MSVPTTTHIPTSELHQGDVVLNHGMRLLLDQPVRNAGRRNGMALDVYVTSALVLNEEKVIAHGTVPHSWLRREKWVDSQGWRIDPTDDPCWSVQGNDLASWSVERAG